VKRTRSQYGGWGCGCGEGAGAPLALALLLLLFGSRPGHIAAARRAKRAAALLVVLFPVLVQAEPLKLVISGVTGPEGTNPAELAGLADVLQSEVVAIGFYQVLTQRDIAAQLGIERQKQLMGCADDESAGCLAEIAGAMNSARVLRGEVSQVEGQLSLTLTLSDGKSVTSVLGRATRRASDLGALVPEIRGAVYEVVNQDPARAKERALAVERGFGGFMVGVRADFDALGLAAAPSISLQYSWRRFGVVLTALLKPNPGARLEGRWYPVTLGRVRPYVLAGGAGSRTGVGLRVGAGCEVHYGHLNAWLDGAYERYFEAPPDFLVDAATVGAGIGWTF
jgi:hypothetical protein